MARNGRAVVDAAAGLPGRGAWVHPDSECVETAIKRRALGRGLRVADLDTSALLTSLSDFEERAERPMDN
ncbi:MAG TPA: YlxR family protein [Pseudolysinimonas sp.]|nr:YlxR family protein [Pseudolysinimonas sp.]